MMLRSMPEFSPPPVIAVAINKSKSSMDALTWAVENLVAPGDSLHLIHVYNKWPIQNIPTSVGQLIRDTVAKFRERQQTDISFFMKKFKNYCEDKKVKPIISLLENRSVEKALVDQISKLGISKLVIGHSSSNKLTLAFSGPAKTDYVANHAPGFCAVMVIKKNKLISKQDSNLPFLSPRPSLSLLSDSASPVTRYCNNTPEAIESPIHPVDTLLKYDKYGSTLKEQDRMILAASENETDATMTEVEKLSLRLQLAEESLSSAANMVAKYSAQIEEEIHMKEVALKKLKLAKEQQKREKIKQGEMSKIIVESLRDLEMYKKLAFEEKQRCEEAVAALERSKRETEMAEQQIATISMELEKTQLVLEREVGLRRDAAEKAYKETLLKQEIGSAFRRAQTKYSVYSFEKLKAATNNFSEELKLGEGGFGCVYKGKIHYTYFAIKVLRQDGLQGHRDFQNRVELLGRIQHPHLAMPVGACPENVSIVYEYMANGSLEDFLSQKPTLNPLPWYVRFRICYEVALGLIFLHTSQPEPPIICCDLTPRNILLDHNFVSKISGVGFSWLIPKKIACFDPKRGQDEDVSAFVYTDPGYRRTGKFGAHSNVYSLGIIILQMLTGNPGIGVADLVEDVLEDEKLSTVLDASAGEWPVEEATKLAHLGLQCAQPGRKRRISLHQVLSALKDIQMVIDYEALSGIDKFIPSRYMCPISQEVMEDPYIAADEFTYECQNITEWLSNHDISPITNMAFAHKNLSPNYALRSEIREWQLRRRHFLKPAVNAERHKCS